MSKRLAAYVLGIPIVVSAILQLQNLDRWGFWFDESFTGALLEYSPSEIVSRTAADVHPPLYYLLLKGWAEIFGYSDFALRSFSVAATVLALVVTAAILMRFVRLRTAFIAISVAALNPFVIKHAQEARMYAFSGLLVALASWQLVRIVQKKRSARTAVDWLIYGLLIAAMAYVHYFSVLILLSHTVFVLWYDKTKSSKSKSLLSRLNDVDAVWLKSLGWSFLLYLPWLPTFYKHLTAVNSNFWIEDVHVFSLQATIVDMFTAQIVTNSSWIAFGILLLPVLLIAFLFKTFTQLSRKERSAAVLLAGGIALPMLFVFVISAIPSIQSVYYIRYFAQFAVIGMAGVGLIVGAGRFQRTSTRLTRLSALVIVLLIASSVLGIRNVYEGEGKNHFMVRELSQEIAQSYQSGDAIAAGGIWEFYDTYRYNNHLSNVSLVSDNRFFGGASLVEGRDDILIDSLEDIQPASGRVWFVSIRDEPTVPDTWQLDGEPSFMGSFALRTYAVEAN